MANGVYQYQAYGLCIESNFPLGPDSSRPLDYCEPDLSLTFCEDAADTVPVERESPWYVSPYLTSDGQPNSIIYRSRIEDRHTYTFSFSDGVLINFAPSTGQITAFWPSNYTAEDAAIYVTGPVIAFALKLSGALTLHASAVNVHGSAVLFMGPSGMGKSTTAAAFARSGYPVITDDLTVLRRESGEFLVEPGLARLCVWPQALDALFGKSDGRYRRISPNDHSWDKRYLELDGLTMQSQSSPLPLDRIYMLERQAPATDKIQVKTISSREAFMSVVTHVYGFYWPLQKARAMEFGMLADFPGVVSVKRLTVPNNLDRLRDLVNEIAAEQNRS